MGVLWKYYGILSSRSLASFYRTETTVLDFQFGLLRSVPITVFTPYLCCFFDKHND